MTMIPHDHTPTPVPAPATSPAPAPAPALPAGPVYFEKRFRIPSCHITKEFLKSLEDYLVAFIAQKLIISPEAVKEEYTLRTVDSKGEASYKSVADLSNLPATIKSISIYISKYASDKKIEVYFGMTPNSDNACVNIQCKGPGSEDACMLLENHLSKILEDIKVTDWLCRQKRFVLGVIGVVVGCAISNVLSSLYIPYSKLAEGIIVSSAISVLFWFVASFAYFVLCRLYPYITFETSTFRNRRRVTNAVMAFVFASVFGSMVAAWIMRFGFGI